MANTLTISASTVAVTPPASPDVCRIYCFFTLLDGSAAENVSVSVYNRFLPIGENQFVHEPKNVVQSDATGLAQFDVVRGTKIKVAIQDTNLVREFTVPDQASANLLTILGETSDAFTVVRD